VDISANSVFNENVRQWAEVIEKDEMTIYLIRP